MIRRIAITGPESTGKSSLAERLAWHYHTVWVPEYARQYLANLNRPYNNNDLVEIAVGQVRLEDNLRKKAAKLLICDTDLLVISIWYRHYYGRLHPMIADLMEHRPYDLYLLMDIDLPWRYDPMREHPHLRKYFFTWYEKELRERKLNYRIISGENWERMQHAVQAVDELLSRPISK